MSKPLEYFKEFLENPKQYNVQDFYRWLHEWIDYVTGHKHEFNYLEDEEWREIKDRVLEALTIMEDLKDEFHDLEDRLDEVSQSGSDAERIEVYTEWLEFMKRYQREYQFTDQQIQTAEKSLNKLILSVMDCEIAEERVRGSQKKVQESTKVMFDALFNHYQKTGKYPVLVPDIYKKRLKGN
jgi:predicted  nucleic acid-binding Zn-ribbon protein